jgi:imidazolonepropionase-like amidohydrolase
MARLLLAAVLLAAFAPQDASELIAVKAGRIWTVSGEVIENGVIVIEKGRIKEIRATADVPSGARVIDASHQTVLPGLIDTMNPPGDPNADSDLTAAPDVLAIDGVDFFRDNRRMLALGVTTVLVSPGSRRLISGQAAVVKTGGSDREARVLKRSWGMRVSLGDVSKNPPGLLDPPMPPSAVDPIRPVRRQYPSSRMGQFAELRRVFAAARDAKSGLSRGSREALQEVLDGRRPFVVSARSSDDLIKAMMFAQETGVKLVLLDGDESDQVADLLVQKKVPVWIRSALTQGRVSDVDASRPAAEFRRDPALPAALGRIGATFALQSSDEGPAELLLLAAYACRAGLNPAQAVRAVTLTPAEILGIADRVGSLEKGKDADLIFLSGPPLSSASVVQKVMIAGEIVFERKPEDDQTYAVTSRARTGAEKAEVVAIRGARILTVTQGIIPEGLIIIEDGKIAYVGRRRPIPVQAKIIEAAGLTASPGMIDAHSFLGFHVDASEGAVRGRRVRAGAPSVTIAAPSEQVRLDDPVFRAAAEAGVTAVLLVPEQSGVCSMLKLEGERASVLRDVAAIKLAVGGGSPGYAGIKEHLARARKYHDEWEAHERAVKEAKEAAKPAPGPAAKPDPITGSWKGTAEVKDVGQRAEFSMELKLAGTAVTGTVTASLMGGTTTQEVKGTFENGDLRIAMEVQGAKVVLTAKVENDAMKGKVEIEADGNKYSGTIEAKRAPPSAQPVAEAAPGDKKEPRKDNSLEPYRRLFRREIPALVTARDISSIENAANAFEKDNSLPWVLLAPEDSDYAAARVPGAIFGPDFFRDRRGAVTNLAEALASGGVPVAFSSSSVSGAAHLPLVVGHAARYGLEGNDALKAVTIHPARMLKLDARLGSLERGRDGDVVLTAGDPFDVSSSVKYVLSGGKVIFKAP